MVTKGERGERINEEFGINIYIHTTTYKIINKDLLYSPENSTQYSVKTRMGKESEKEKKLICVYVYSQNSWIVPLA